VPGNAARPVHALEKRRTLFDSVALALAALPALLAFYPTIVTAPIVVYLAARHWKSPSSIVPRGKWRFVVALIIVFLELAIITLVIVSFFLYRQSKITGAP
jgi:hypothetical protein